MSNIILPACAVTRPFLSTAVTGLPSGSTADKVKSSTVIDSISLPYSSSTILVVLVVAVYEDILAGVVVFAPVPDLEGSNTIPSARLAMFVTGHL